MSRNRFLNLTVFPACKKIEGFLTMVKGRNEKDIEIIVANLTQAKVSSNFKRPSFCKLIMYS